MISGGVRSSSIRSNSLNMKSKVWRKPLQNQYNQLFSYQEIRGDDIFQNEVFCQYKALEKILTVKKI